jgi:hypothetical protein
MNVARDMDRRASGTAVLMPRSDEKTARETLGEAERRRR